MSALADALVLDAKGLPMEAAEAYEEVIAKGVDSADAYRNLVALYVACLDTGYASAHGIAQPFIDRADRRIRELISAANARFGIDPELDFWWRYYRFSILGEEWDDAFPQSYLDKAEAEKALAPFYALVLTHGQDYAGMLKALAQSTSSQKTERERQLHSMAISALRHSPKGGPSH